MSKKMINVERSGEKVRGENDPRESVFDHMDEVLSLVLSASSMHIVGILVEAKLACFRD